MRSTTLVPLLLALASPALAVRYYVDDDAAPGGDGLSWASAFDSLDDALAVITPGDRIWLAEGNYVPGVEQVPGDPRSRTFLVPAGVRIFGGFDGTEGTLAERAGLFDSTLLSGELGAPGPLDNAYHVVHVLHPSGIPPGGNRIDGLTVAHGNATNGASQGGGILSFNVGLRLQNVTVRDNAAVNGAGVHAQPASLTLIDCVIEGNRALNNGGALWGQAIEIKAFNTRFASNSAGARGGGAYMHSMSSFPDVVVFANCLFHDNFAPVGGGAFVGGGNFSSGSASFRGCTFAYNAASVRGGALRANTAPALPARVQLHDSIVWDNRAPEGAGVSGRPTVTSSDVQDAFYSPALGNLSVDPLFADGPGRNLRLAPGSPCIDAGDDAQVSRDYRDLDGDGDFLEPVPFDFDGAPRFVDDPAVPNTGSGVVDMGAFERQGG